MANQGTFIVLEGADGSGKGTQFRLLKERLKAVGYDVAVFDFPRYSEPSSYFVRRYLNGDYGPAASVSPYTASLFYALDRFEAAPEIKQALTENKIVLCNRYVGSNMAHMGAKIEDPIEQRSFFVWEDSLEFQLLGLPRPNINIFLDVPAEVSYELIAKKSAREYTAKNRDEHEADKEHLKKAVSTYKLLCQLFPADFVAVDCMIGNKLLDIPEINNRIWRIVQTHLPASPQGPAHGITLKLSESEEPTKAKPPKTARGGDGQKSTHDFGLLSLELLLQIEALNPDLVDYSLDWQSAGGRFYTPPGFSKKEQAAYKKFMEELAGTYREGVKAKDRAVKEAWRLVIPAAALLKATFNLRPTQTDDLRAHLLGIGSPEAIELAAKVGKITGAGAQAAKTGEEPEQLGSIISKIARENLSGNLSAETDSVRLSEAIPRNEFKLLTDIVYPFSNLSRSEIETNVEGWNYQQKVDTLQAAILDKAKTLAEVRYRFDILVDRPTLRDILGARLALEVNLQPASPRFGYEVPAEIPAESQNSFEECFDKSLELFSLLQKDHPRLASLATLAGHKVRAHLLIGFFDLASKAADSSLPSRLRDELSEKVGEVHPVMGASLAKSPAAKEPTRPAGHSRRHRNRKKS